MVSFVMSARATAINCGTHQERSRAQTSRDVKPSHRIHAYRRRGVIYQRATIRCHDATESPSFVLGILYEGDYIALFCLSWALFPSVFLELGFHCKIGMRTVLSRTPSTASAPQLRKGKHVYLPEALGSKPSLTITLSDPTQVSELSLSLFYTVSPLCHFIFNYPPPPRFP
jgi:hypothetical protein